MLSNFLYVLIIGLIAGFLAGQVMKGKGFGLVGNIIVGVIGAFLGNFLFGLLNISMGGDLGFLIMSFIGAIALIFIVGTVKKL